MTSPVAGLPVPGGRVAVIGAGVAGLVTVKALREEGLEPVCFERSDAIGGVWKYVPEAPGGGGVAYRSLSTNTSRQMTALSDFPFPEHLPDFPARADVLRYLQDYAAHFGLYAHIHLETAVEAVAPATGERWTLTWQDAGGQTERETFDGLVVATGFYSVPVTPDLPGLEDFDGETLHSFVYNTPEPFAGRRVVVIGAGSSGCDVAAEVAQVAAGVELAAKSGILFVPHYVRGRPLDHALSRAGMLIPDRVRLRTFQRLLRDVYRQMGVAEADLPAALSAADFSPTAQRVTPGTEIIRQLAQGRLRVRPSVRQVKPGSVTFEDGKETQADVLIFATGYASRYPFLAGLYPGGQVDPSQFYKLVFPPGQPGLAFVGMCGVNGPAFPVFEMQARWAARVFAGKKALPAEAEMLRAVKAHNAEHAAAGTSPVRVPRVEYCEEVAREIGVQPRVWRHPGLWRELLLGPLVAAQYRLDGPGQTPQAAAWIRAANRRTRAAVAPESAARGIAG